jgi:glycogen(starch) synthase
MLQAADWVVGVSSAMLQEARRRAPEIIPRSSVIHPSLPAVDREAAPPPSDHVFLAAGRLIPEKGFDVVLKAFARIVERFPRTRLVIAGDGSARPELTRLASQFALGDRVEFPGWVAPDAMADLIRASSIVVVPSRWQEPFGLVALQAGQESRPVVASRVGGLPEIVVDGETGLLVESENPSALADAMAYLIENPDEAGRLGANGRRRAKLDFDWSAYVRVHTELYARLLGARA